MKDNKKLIIALILVIVVLVAIIVYLLLNNAENKNVNTTSGGEEVVAINAINDENAINELYKLNDRYANLTSEQINEMIEKRSIDKVSAVIKEGTLTKEGATVVITDKNDYPYSYGEDFDIQKLKDGKWEDLKSIGNSYINDIAHVIKEDGTTEIKLNWKDRYGKLETGNYKLIMPINQEESISTEFEIK